MFNSSSLTNIEHLRDWFMATDRHGYVSLYRGSEKKTGERIFASTYQTAEDGWQLLQHQLIAQTVGGGLFTIYIARDEKDTSGFTTRYSSPIALAGLNGIQQSSAINPEAIQGMISARVNEAIGEYKKDRLIEDLQDQLKEKNKASRNKGITGMLSSIGEVLEENPTLATIVSPLIQGIVAKFLGTSSMPVMAGTPRNITHVKDDSDESQDEEFTEDENQKISEGFALLQKHFDDPVNVFYKICNWIDQNPDQAKMLFNSIT